MTSNASNDRSEPTTAATGDKVYRCEHGHKTATRTASGAWIGHAHPFWCQCQKDVGTLVILPRRGVNR